MNFSFMNPIRRVRILCALALVTLTGMPFLGPTLAAQTNAQVAAGNRYLLIVETASGMRRRAENVQATLASLLGSGMNGQLQEGDTIGLWTFDEDLYTGQFPLQHWSQQGGQRIATVLVDYLRTQFTNRPANPAKVFKAMTDLMHRSEKITVVLVTDGMDNIVGTPADADINENFRLNSAAQQKARMPFITVLRARRGAFIGWRVSVPPWPIEFPPFPPEPKKPQPVAKVEPEVKPVPTPAPEKVQTPAPIPPEPVPPPLPAPEKPPVNEPAPAVAVVTNVPPPEPVVIATPVPVDVPVTNIAQAKPVQTVPPSTSSAVAEPPYPGAWPTPKNATRPPPPVPPVADVPQVAPPQPVPPPAPVVPDEKVTSTPPVPAVAPKVTAPVVNKTPSVQTAAATPPEPSGFKRTNLLIGGIALMLGAGILLFLQLRRPSRAEKVSLITHAVDREDK